MTMQTPLPKPDRNTLLKKKVLILFFYLSPLFPLQFYMHGNWYSIASTWTIALIVGMVAFIFFLNAIILASRIPFLERILGIDGMIRIHIVQASLGLVLGIVHGQLREAEAGEFLLSSWYIMLAKMSLLSIVIIIVLTTLFMVNSPLSERGFVNRLRIFVHNRLMLRYAFWRRVHSLQLFAMLLLVVHMYFASSTQETYGRMVVMGIYSLAAALAFLYRFVYLPYTSYHFELGGITKVAKNAMQLCLSSENTKSEILIDRLMPGQFVYFSLHSPRRISQTRFDTSEHPFTLSKIDQTQRKLYITAKQFNGLTRQFDDLKKALENKAKIRVRLKGPYGKLVLPAHDLSQPFSAPHHVFYAAGIGSTPFSAMLEDIASSVEEDILMAEGVPAITLLYSGKKVSHMPFVNRLIELVERLPRLSVRFFLTEDFDNANKLVDIINNYESHSSILDPSAQSLKDRITVYERRITADDIKLAHENPDAEPNFSKQKTIQLATTSEYHYVCGTSSFISHIRRVLKTLGVGKACIKFEKFSF